MPSHFREVGRMQQIFIKCVSTLLDSLLRTVTDHCPFRESRVQNTKEVGQSVLDRRRGKSSSIVPRLGLEHVAFLEVGSRQPWLSVWAVWFLGWIKPSGFLGLCVNQLEYWIDARPAAAHSPFPAYRSEQISLETEYSRM